MNKKNIIACIAFLFAAQAVSAQNQAETFVRLLVNQLKSHKNLEMAFNYQISQDGKNSGKSEKGHAWLQGEAYKVEMADQQTISDGKTIWTYFVDADEVMVSNANEGADNTPLKLLTSLDENYVATLTNIDPNGLATIELANPQGQYQRVTLKINVAKAEIKSADIYVDDGSKVVVTVEQMKFDQELGDKFFTFDTQKYPNVDVIDMR